MALTKIEWATYTFNPWIGCTKVDELCAHCYAESDDQRRGWTPEGWGKGKPRHRTSEAYWRQPLKWDTEEVANRWWKCDRCGKTSGRSTLTHCLCGGRLIEQRPRVFCASLADVFDAEVPDLWRHDLFYLIWQTPRLDWLLLTKRPERMRAYLQQLHGWPWRHVWLGTSVGTPEGLPRVRSLLHTPAALRFLSMEPLLAETSLAAVELTPSLMTDPLRGVPGAREKIDWVIAGGESGMKARPTHPQWLRLLRDQCAAAGTPFHFKQWGEWLPAERNCLEQIVVSTPIGVATPKYPRFFHWPDGQVSARVRKQAAGRVLDGVEHNGFPVSPASLSL